jgi:hypothetical protein
MKAKFDPTLEQLIHQELKKLPPVKAPTTLAARVLAAVRARKALPWWQQSFWHWPVLAKAAFLLFAALIVLSLTGGTWFAGEVASTSSGVAKGFMNFVNPLATAMAVMWRSFLQTLVIWGLGAAAMLYFFCVGAGTLFVRVAYKRA